MDKRGWMILRVLMNRYQPQACHALLKFLPSQDRQAITSLEIQSRDLTPILQQPERALANIHYSWIQPVLEKFSDRLQPVVLASLTHEQRTGLKVSSPPSISQVAKIFILNQLYDMLEISAHFPLEYLPETELSPLATWTKQQLTHLIDFLGLHDLASEVRRIVNRNHLKNIYHCLTARQLRYLKICLHQKEQLISPKLGIDPAKQDCVKLRQVLHRRGLVRLGRALCGQHPDLIWHIAHTLDKGRGEFLLKEYQPQELAKITSILRQQVLNLMNFFKGE